MQVLTADFIEYGRFIKDDDEYEMALVYGTYEVTEMTDEQVTQLTGDWIIPALYDGEIIIVNKVFGS